MSEPIKSRVRIATGEDTSALMDAWLLPDVPGLIISESLGYPGYTLTHYCSGCSINGGVYFRTVDDAHHAARDLSALGLDFTRGSLTVARDMQDVAEAVLDVYSKYTVRVTRRNQAPAPRPIGAAGG